MVRVFTYILPVLRRVRHFLYDRSGSAAIQFGLVVPVLILIVFGGLDLSRAVFTQNSLEHAVNQTVRFASVHGAASDAPASLASLQSMASNLAGIDPNAAATAVNWAPDNFPGSTVTVTMNYDYAPLTLYVFGGNVALNATASRTITR